MQLAGGCSDCFAGLSCKDRLEIIKLLQKTHKLPVSEIAKHFKTSQPTISHHLKYLKDMGILKSQKEGRNVYYFIDPKCGWDNCELFQ